MHRLKSADMRSRSGRSGNFKKALQGTAATLLASPQIQTIALVTTGSTLSGDLEPPRAKWSLLLFIKYFIKRIFGCVEYTYQNLPASQFQFLNLLP